MANEFNIERQRHTKRDPETSLYFWHPDRFGVRLAPAAFRTRLKELHGDLECTWHPLAHRWLVWYRRPRIQNYMCPGWLLLFVVEDSANEFVPLDERVFAAIEECSVRKHGSPTRYSDRIAAELERDKRSLSVENDERARFYAGDRWDYAQIKNIGTGSKFATYHQ